MFQDRALHPRVQQISATTRWIDARVRPGVRFARGFLLTPYLPTLAEFVDVCLQLTVGRREIVRRIAVEVTAEAAGLVAVAGGDVHLGVTVTVPYHLHAYTRDHRHEVAVFGNVQVRETIVGKAH